VEKPSSALFFGEEKVQHWGTQPVFPAERRDPEPVAPSTVLSGEPTATPAPIVEGPVLAGYEVLGELGRGGMGVVYKARHLTLKRLVALKMILSGSYAGSRALARFEAEARAVARLQHPNIVQIYEVGESEGNPFFSLEYVEGGCLAHKLAREGPMASVVAVPLMATLARAVHFAHERGIVHRDLKPANVLLAADGTPKITDFGIAKQLDEVAMNTDTGAVLGTPGYMAPEQAEGKSKAVGPACDVWALGAILYELLTGRPPFQAETPFDTLLQVVSSDPVPVRQLQPKIPRDLETICLKCLQKDRRRRYASALALAEDLDRFHNHEPIQARRVGSLERAGRWMRRRPAAATGILGGAALIVIFSGVVGHEVRTEQHRREQARAVVHDLLDEGKQARTREELEKAQSNFADARRRVDAESALADISREVHELYDEVEGRLTARQRYRQCGRLRDDALFQATLSAGDAAAGNLGATLSQARAALAAADDKGLRLEYLTEPQRFEVTQGRYELLLVLAEATAQPRPGLTNHQLREKAQEALGILDQAKDLGPRTQTYFLRRARYLAQLGNKDEAQEAVRQAEACPPSTAFDHYLVGVERYRQGPEAAKPSFVEALRLQPDNFWARYFLALCYVRQGKFEAARDSLTPCVQQQPDVVWIYLLRGFAQGQLEGQSRAAEADFERAQELLAKSPSREAEYVLLNNRAVLRLGENRFAEAIKDLEEAGRLRPDQYQAYASLAQVYVQLNKTDKAIEAFGSAIAAAQELVSARQLEAQTLALLYRNRARIHLARTDRPRALSDLEESIRTEPAGSPARGVAYADYGRALALAQRKKEAIDAFEASLKARPGHTDTLRRRASLLFEMERWADAAEDISRYVRAGGRQTARLYQMRGLARVRLQDNKGALEDFSSAVECDPKDAALRTQRGQLYLVSKAFEHALADFEEAWRRDPACAAAGVGRGYARVQLGHWVEGIADVESALRSTPITPRLAHNAAEVYAQAVARLKATPGSDPLALRRCEERALALLRQSLALLPPPERPAFWRTVVGKDPALNPLHAHEAFALLDRQYTAAAGRSTAGP
jgi:tetratricopeptide (TPR) repeat protein